MINSNLSKIVGNRGEWDRYEGKYVICEHPDSFLEKFIFEPLSSDVLTFIFIQEDYDRLRPLTYMGADIILVCFAIDNRESFKNVTDYWYPELNQHIPDVPTLLVGTKTGQCLV